MQRRLSNSAEVRVFKLDYERVIRELVNYAKKVLKRGAEAVILVGSLARGDYTPFSDADVIIVVKRDDRRAIDRVVEYMDPETSIDIEPRVYTVNELLKMAMERRRIIREMVDHGKLLGGDENILRELKRLYLHRAPGV